MNRSQNFICLQNFYVRHLGVKITGPHSGSWLCHHSRKFYILSFLRFLLSQSLKRSVWFTIEQQLQKNSVGFKKTNADLQKLNAVGSGIGEFNCFRIRIPRESQINTVPNPELGSYRIHTVFLEFTGDLNPQMYLL